MSLVLLLLHLSGGWSPSFCLALTLVSRPLPSFIRTTLILTNWNPFGLVSSCQDQPLVRLSQALVFSLTDATGRRTGLQLAASLFLCGGPLGKRWQVFWPMTAKTITALEQSRYLYSSQGGGSTVLPLPLVCTEL